MPWKHNLGSHADPGSACIHSSRCLHYKRSILCLNWGCAMLHGLGRSLLTPGALPNPWKSRASLISCFSPSFLPACSSCPLFAPLHLSCCSCGNNNPKGLDTPLLCLQTLWPQHNHLFSSVWSSTNKSSPPALSQVAKCQPSVPAIIGMFLEKIAGVSMKGKASAPCRS